MKATWVTIDFLFIENKDELVDIVNNQDFNMPNYLKKI